MAAPFWKLRREVLRLRDRLRAWPRRWLEPSRQRRHDARRPGVFDVVEGAAPPSDRVALLLIYQPGGVRASTLWTCEYLSRRGYAPLVVSNAPVGTDDRRRLAGTVWRLVERPNLGYDFGGYRDGLWLLDHWGVRPEAVLMLNDSIWFPLEPRESLIDAMEAAPAPFLGALREPRRPRRGRRAREPFLASFLLMFKRPVLESAAFRAFWSDYRLTDDKHRTIRAGERGLSAALAAAGFEPQAMFERDRFDRDVRAADEATLRQLLDRLVMRDPADEAEVARLRDRSIADEAGRQTLAEAIIDLSHRHTLLFTVPAHLLMHYRVPYLKRYDDPHNRRALARLLQPGPDQLAGGWHPAVRAEVAAMVAWPVRPEGQA